MYQEYEDEIENVTEAELLANVYGNDDVDDHILYQQSMMIQEQLLYQQLQSIPEAVRNFILQLHRAIVNHHNADLSTLYEQSWQKLSEKFYAKEAWPEAEFIAPLVQNEPIVLVLYRELYYRHVYSRLQPTLEQRFASYENYLELFNYVLNAESPVPLDLPNQWLWDIVDEFIYQYQSFSLFRDRVVRAQQAEDGDAEEDIHQLFAVFRDHPQVWNTYAVLNILYSLVSKSNIQQQLRALKAGQDVAHVAGEFGHANIYKMLGYFGLVGLVRLHCIMGDYALALNTLADVDLTKRVAMARATSCHVSTYYYVGFSYMMLGRYADAVRTFSHILIFINRAKQYNPRTYQYDQMNKLADKMHALLTICISLAPMRLDESIHSQIRDKFTESLTRMQRADLDALQAYNELFIYACPRYIAPMAVGLDSDTPVPDRSAFQARIFVSNVERQLRIPILRSFLKLYTTLGVERLASFLEMEEDELMTLLLLFKQTTRQTKWNEGLLLDEGERTLVSDLDCSINVDTVIIAESKMGRRFGDWFLRNSSKFHDLQVSVQKTAAKAQ